MAVADGFHVDSNGNLWLGSNRETFDATTRSEAPFYVYANGDMVANSGTFAGTLSSGISISAPVITGGSISGTSGSFTGSISGASGTFTGDLSGSDITGGTIDIGSGTFTVDSAGAMVATSATITGSITSDSGTIGGISINSGDIQANYSAGSSGFLIESDGDAFFNSVDVRIGDAPSATPSTGKTTLDVGNTQIYTFNNDLYLNTTGTNNAVYVKDQLILTASSSSASNMQLMFDGVGSGDAMGFWHDSDFPNSSDAELYWTNQSGSGDYNKIAYVTTQDDYFHLGSDAPGIKTDFTGSPTMYFDGPGSPGTDSATFNMAVRPYTIKDKDGQVGSSGQVLSSTGSRIDWIDLPTSGGAHADSDHTSFASTTSLNTHTASTSAHGYSPISINGLTMEHGFGLTIQGSGDIGVSSSGNPHTITISHDDSDHSFSSSNVSVSAGAVTSNAGYFLRTLSASNNVITYNRSDFGSGLKINSQRPTSNNNSSVGISTIEYNEMHSRNGNFTFVYGANLGSSSQEIKTDVTDLDLGLNFINDLTPKKYKYVSQVKENDDKYGFGFIAEDIEQVLVDNSETDSKLFVDGRDDYSSYGRCAHELTCTCEDEDCCSYPTETYNADTGEHTSTEGCMFDAKCVQPCCTDIAGATIDGVNYIHATEAECEEEFIVSQKYPSLKYDELIAPLVKAVQELSAKNDELQSRIEELEG